MTGPLLIEGNLPVARMSVDGKAALRDTKRALVAGGRGLLMPVERKPFRVVGDESGDGIVVLSIGLLPEVERRIRISGGNLSEEEIVAGFEQLREGDEDFLERMKAERLEAYRDGYRYVMQQMRVALEEGDERALGQAYDVARKTMTLVRGIRRDSAAGSVVEGQSAPSRPLGTDTTGEEQQ